MGEPSTLSSEGSGSTSSRYRRDERPTKQRCKRRLSGYHQPSGESWSRASVSSFQDIEKYREDLCYSYGIFSGLTSSLYFGPLKKCNRELCPVRPVPGAPDRGSRSRTPSQGEQTAVGDPVLPETPPWLRAKLRASVSPTERSCASFSRLR